ncbi:MAG: hypothetical protein ABIO68_01055 [Sphingomicrobium sp.]
MRCAVSAGIFTAMRRIILASTLMLSACATAPRQPDPVPVAATPVVPDRAGLVGLSAQQLVGKLGNPALQVREGASLKLQFRNSRCVIDAYLYPVGGNAAALRVEHIDTRAPSGVKSNEEVCVALFQSKAS